MSAKPLDPLLLERIQSWIDGPVDSATKGEIGRLLEEDPEALQDAFFKDLSFGTGGMRGIMGVGSNRMNLYTIRKASQGLANYIKKLPEKKGGFSVFIGYDVRHNSKEFAQEAACVFLGNGIGVFLTEKVSPTPLVSFGCRYYDCALGVMITASHNPPEYNGFKVYWSDGCQVVFPHDKGIMDEVKKISSFEQITRADSPANLHLVGDALDELYFSQMKKLALISREEKGPSLKIVYTNLHGTGLHYVPRALKDRGFKTVFLVEKQKKLDGAFPCAPIPNPEDRESLALGIQEMLEKKGDLLLATDPDADRVAAVALDHGKPFALSGNQTACLCLQHILENSPNLPPNAAFIKSIVTTELFREIAEKHEKKCVDVLTGFKYIGEKIGEWERSFGGYQYIFGAEESYGYLLGTYVRDKDAISSACLIAEAALCLARKNKTLVDQLYFLYKTYGLYREKLLNLKYPETFEGHEKMKGVLKKLRTTPPLNIGQTPVSSIEDYLSGISHHLLSGEKKVLGLPKSDVLCFWLVDGSKIVIRPSGTEPKIKVYLEVVERGVENLPTSIQQADEKLETLAASFQKLL